MDDQTVPGPAGAAGPMGVAGPVDAACRLTRPAG